MYSRSWRFAALILVFSRAVSVSAQSNPVAPQGAPWQGTQASAPDMTPRAAPPHSDAASAPMAPAGSSLVPEGEAERMATREVTQNVSFVPGKGVRIQSADGDFSWSTNARLQAMEMYQKPHGGSAATNLLVRRARLMFFGNIFGQATKYKIELGFSPSDLGEVNNLTAPSPTASPLMDWYLDFTQLRDASFRVGQRKVPYNRQFVLSAGTLQLADLSLATQEFNLTRDNGLTMYSNNLGGLGLFRYSAGVFSGRGRDAFGANNTHLMYTGRLEVLPFGMFSDYSEADFERSLKPRLSLGVAYAYFDHAQRDRGDFGAAPTDGGTTNIHNLVVDSMFKFAGFSFLGEFLMRHGVRKPGAAGQVTAARNGWGVTAQAGYLLPRLPLEFAARYSTAQGTGKTSLVDNNELGGGVNWYFARHALKIQLDYFRIWKASSPTTSARFSDGGDRVRVLLAGEI